MSNYPDSVSAGDPSAPWNAEDGQVREYLVTITVTCVVDAYDEEDAQERASEKLYGTGLEAEQYIVEDA